MKIVDPTYCSNFKILLYSCCKLSYFKANITVIEVLDHSRL